MVEEEDEDIDGSDSGVEEDDEHSMAYHMAIRESRQKFVNDGLGKGGRFFWLDTTKGVGQWAYPLKTDISISLSDGGTHNVFGMGQITYDVMSKAKYAFMPTGLKPNILVRCTWPTLTINFCELKLCFIGWDEHGNLVYFIAHPTEQQKSLNLRDRATPFPKDFTPAHCEALTTVALEKYESNTYFKNSKIKYTGNNNLKAAWEKRLADVPERQKSAGAGSADEGDSQGEGSASEDEEESDQDGGAPLTDCDQMIVWAEMLAKEFGTDGKFLSKECFGEGRDIVNLFPKTIFKVWDGISSVRVVAATHKRFRDPGKRDLPRLKEDGVPVETRDHIEKVAECFSLCKLLIMVNSMGPYRPTNPCILSAIKAAGIAKKIQEFLKIPLDKVTAELRRGRWD